TYKKSVPQTQSASPEERSPGPDASTLSSMANSSSRGHSVAPSMASPGAPRQLQSRCMEPWGACLGPPWDTSLERTHSYPASICLHSPQPSHWSLLLQNPHMWSWRRFLGSRQVCMVPLGSPRASDQVIMSIRTKLQNKEYVTEALCRAKLNSLAARRLTSQRNGASLKFNADKFEGMVAKKWLIPDGCGVKYIPNHSPDSGQVASPAFLKASTVLS
ncbi:hypothetical protein A6R68_23202, partial [Neotoma lepida]